MPAAFVNVENVAGIGGQFGERKMMRGMIPGGTAAHNAIASVATDQHQFGRSGLRAALGTTGDMNRPGETKPRQQRRQPAAIAARVQSGGLTTGSTRAGF